MRAAAALTFLLLAAAPVSAEVGRAIVEGVSLRIDTERDDLTLKLPFIVTPEYQRLEDPARVVIVLPAMEPSPTLFSVIDGKSSPRFERIVAQTIRREAVAAGAASGVRYRYSAPAVQITAYLKPDIDVSVGLIEREHLMVLHFYPLNAAAEQQMPAQLAEPENELRFVRFSRLDNSETIELHFTYPVSHDYYEASKPERLFLLLRRTDISQQAQQDIKSILQMTRMFNLEIFNIGSRPTPYPEMNMDREFHFVDYPSPLAFDPFYEKVIGYQQRDAMVTVRATGKLAYNMTRDSDGRRILLTVFAVPADRRPVDECMAFYEERFPYLTTNPPVEAPFQIETEMGTIHTLP